MWAPGVQAGAVTSVTYAGTALVDGTDYYYGVRVSDGVKWSDWTEVLFHTNTPPTAPTLTSPADGTTDVTPGTVTLTWSAATDAETDSLTYYWYLSTASDFSTIADSGTATGLTVDVTASESTQYYWRVQAWDGWEFGANSTDFDFTTGVLVTSGSVSGVVVDQNGETVHGATVELIDDAGAVVDTQTTGANGRFTFTNVDLGTYSISVSASGFETETVGNIVVSDTDPDQDVGTVSLTAKAAVEPFPLWLILLLIIIIVAIILALLLLMKRKKPAPEEAPPPEAALEETVPPEGEAAPPEPTPAPEGELPPPEGLPPPEDLPPPDTEP
jgi:hypothetical protein